MDKTAKVIFSDYVSRLMRSPRRFELWKVRAVEAFLESGSPLTRKGISDYVTTLRMTAAHTPGETEEVLGELIPGGGRGERRKREDVAAPPLMKVPLSEGLEDSLRGFVRWMTLNREFSPATVRTYHQGVRRFLEMFPVVTQKNVVSFKQHMVVSGLSPKTVNLRIAAVVCYGRFLGRRVEVRRLRVVRALECDNVPTEEEMMRYLCHVRERNRRWYLISRCLSTTGLRVHELLKVTIRDIMAGSVILTGKGGKPRRVFFQRRFVEEVRDYLENSGRVSEEDRLCHVTARGVAQQMRIYSMKAGLDVSKFHPHAFRHYFAKQYLRHNPGDIVGLQNLLGHSSMETTGIYLQRSYEEQLRGYSDSVTWE